MYTINPRCEGRKEQHLYYQSFLAAFDAWIKESIYTDTYQRIDVRLY